MTAKILFMPNALRCECCASAPGSRFVESAWVCPNCANDLQPPQPVPRWPKANEMAERVSLEEIIDTLLREPQ